MPNFMLLRFILLATILTMSISSFGQDSPSMEKGVSQKLAKWRAANYSDVRYKLNLTIEKKAPTLKGSIEISVKSKAKRIILDWRKIKGSEHLSKTSNVSINGTKLILNPEQPSPPNKQPPMYSHYFEHLIFEDGAKIGENLIEIDFESPILTSGGAITRYIDKEDGTEYIYSLFVPSDASTAFPVFDQPDLKARFTLDLNVPKDWQVISNAISKEINIIKEDGVGFGRRKNYSQSEKKEIEFEETKPISTYVFAFAAGEFEEFNEQGRNATVKVRVDAQQDSTLTENTLPNGRVSTTKVYVRKSQAEKFKQHSKEIFRLNRESIKYLEEYFDYNFPFPKYDLVLIPEFPFGGMEHAGATFLRESSIIFPSEPTANNYISRASLLFHENAHQWFGDTVTMKWFDDLWLKEGFATFMAYKAMEKVLPEYDVWKVFYERTKQRAYLTDVTKGTTPIYQEIPNLNSAKSAYGNIVYQKAPSFLKQAEFYLGEKDFQTAVRSFLKKHEFANADWSDLVDEFSETTLRTFRNSDAYSKLSEKNRKKNESIISKDINGWAETWVNQKGLPIYKYRTYLGVPYKKSFVINNSPQIDFRDETTFEKANEWNMRLKMLVRYKNENAIQSFTLPNQKKFGLLAPKAFFSKRFRVGEYIKPDFVFPNHQDYGYGIFLLDEKSRKYIVENIQNEKDDFLRSMMWGSLWDSVRFAELDPKDYVELAIKNIEVEKDVSTISSILGRVNTAMTYYLSESEQKTRAPKLENLLIDKMQNAESQGERITFYRAFLRIAASENARKVLKEILNGTFKVEGFNCKGKACSDLSKVAKDKLGQAQDLPLQTLLKSRDKFDIVTRLIVLNDKDAAKLLAELEKTEKGDAAKRYAYAAKAGFATKENKAKYWNDFVNNKEISESWIEAAFGVWNSPSHSELTLPYLEKALAELPNHKQNRKIFFVNGWTASFIGGQKSETAMKTVNNFLKDNPKLDADLQRKVLERLDGLERAVKIREKYTK